MTEFKYVQPEPIPVDILMRVIELNEAVVKQNALIVQALTISHFIVKGDKND